MAAIDRLLDEMLARGGSHLHLGVDATSRARLRGDLVALAGEAEGSVEQMLLEPLGAERRATLDDAGELDFVYECLGVRFRASYYRRMGGLAAVFRALPRAPATLAELGCPEALWRFAHRKSGLVLVASPARGGRSTTLAALVDHVNKTRACHVLAIEDPIEVVFDSKRAQITQREVGVHVPSLAEGLRDAPREDADVVVAAELEGAEAVGLALGLARAGVLVIGGVRALGVANVIEAVASAFAPAERTRARAALAEVLSGVAAQRLVRSGDGRKRVAIHEVLQVSPPAAASIRDADDAALAKVMRDENMPTFDAALAKLVASGQVVS